jgi:uncharacterized protein
VLTSVIRAAMHIQYDWYYMSEILMLGLLLGYLRHKSGSTWLTVVVHAAVNIASVVENVLMVAYST